MANFFPLQASDSVKINDGVDELKINTDGSINTAGINLTCLSGSKLGAGSTTIGTVPANKIWKVYGFSLSGSFSSTNPGAISANLALNAVVVLYAAGYSYQSTSVGHSSSYAPPGAVNLAPNYITLTAGQTATVTASAGSYGFASIYYVEENV